MYTWIGLGTLIIEWDIKSAKQMAIVGIALVAEHAWTAGIHGGHLVYPS